MKYFEQQLSVPYSKAGLKSPEKNAVLACYLRDDQCAKSPRQAVIICPGGGYEFVSSREAEPIALKYLGCGMQTFILTYNCSPMVFPGALMELASSVSYVREHADEWNIDPDSIFIAGFSAGAHLAASLGCFWNREFLFGPMGMNPRQIKPDGNILSYPVITSGEYAHRGSFDALCRGLDNSYLELTSLEKQVSSSNPPSFIWHTAEDAAVPLENSLMYANALYRKHVPVEYHIFPFGGHGLSLADSETITQIDEQPPKVQKWFELSVDWIHAICERRKTL